MADLNVKGRYEGKPIIELLDDGRKVKLFNELTYVDYMLKRWPVPKGATVDGASIPQALWSIVGSPLTGTYRNASIIHDWYCDRRITPWQRVHQIFYEAMLTDGVSPIRAKVMYSAVYWGGPRWSDTVTKNNVLAAAIALLLPNSEIARGATGNLGSRGEIGNLGATWKALRTARSRTVSRYQLTEEDVRALEMQVEATDPDLKTIDSIIDQRLETETPVVETPKEA